MAESKRADSEEKYELPVPPFDAEKYVAREIIGARASVVVVLYGFLLGQIGSIAGLYLKNGVAPLSVFLFGLVALKGIFQITGVTYEDWDKKGWAANIGLLFFTFLGAWILFQNEPFVVS